MRNLLYFCLFLLAALSSCKTTLPVGSFDPSRTATPPDYSDPYFWAALPSEKDQADRTPKGLEDRQATAKADVFFLHPTIYSGEKGDDQWNGPVNDPKLNKRVDESTIRYQASLFNGAGRVFAPRYRQAHIHTYRAKNKDEAERVFDLAYSDTKKAFQYYLDNYNEGRPIIIASHSQGTTHSKRLVKDFFDGTALQSQLVAAYLVGIPVLKNEFDHIPVCESASQTGCFVSWRTFETDYTPDWATSEDIAVVNPLTWTIQPEKAGKDQNKGAVLKRFKKIRPELASAKIVSDKGILWADKPKFPGSFLLKTKNYHAADFNFYYLNVRQNAQERVQAFLKQQ